MATRSVESILVVGEGLAGLMTALALRVHHPDRSIRILRSPNQSILEVPASTQGSVPSFLHEFLDIPEPRFLRLVRPGWKYSLYYTNWGPDGGFHHSFDQNLLERRDETEPRPRFASRLLSPPKDLTPARALCNRGKSPFIRTGRGLEYYPFIAYHLDPHRLVEFLRDRAREKNIDIRTDHVGEVRTGAEGIASLRGESGQQYRADLYVDCTGFSRVLHRELSEEMVSFQQPLDRALTLREPLDPGDVFPATRASTMPAGWMWQIDLPEVRCRGYVYASDFVTPERARRQFRDRLDANGESFDVDSLRFPSGYMARRPWMDNCVALGNAQGFLEPLESPSLDLLTRTARVLSRSLFQGDGRVTPSLRGEFNRFVRRNWSAARDFLQLPYRFARGMKTEFWKQAARRALSDRTRRVVRYYRDNGFVRPPAWRDPVFPIWSYLTLLGGLGVECDPADSPGDPRSSHGGRPVRDWIRNNRNIARSAVDLGEVYSSNILTCAGKRPFFDRFRLCEPSGSARPGKKGVSGGAGDPN